MKQNIVNVNFLPFLLFLSILLTNSSKAFSGDSLDDSVKNGFQVGLVGEFNYWSFFGDEDHWMTQSDTDPDIWTTTITLTNEMSWYDPPEVIEVKFRVNQDWQTNWGADNFPSGFGYQNGPNIPIPIDLGADKDIYFVTFNSSTGEYSFMPLNTLPLNNFAVYLGLVMIIGFVFFRSTGR